jgi:nucleoid-associated protein EbfC
MKQVQKMMADTQRIEEELGEVRLEATSGGGMVKAVANGKGEFIDIIIDKSVVDPEDVEMLQDLIVSAVREALEQGAELKASKLEAITGGLSIPGLM